MDVREKLVELLKEIVAIQECGFGDPRPTYETVASYLISHGVTVQEWISARDRLPEDFAQVLICSVIGNQYVAQHLRGHFYSDGINIGTSHWMPLPQPPKGE